MHSLCCWNIFYFNRRNCAVHVCCLQWNKLLCKHERIDSLPSMSNLLFDAVHAKLMWSHCQRTVCRMYILQREPVCVQKL